MSKRSFPSMLGSPDFHKAQLSAGRTVTNSSVAEAERRPPMTDAQTPSAESHIFKHRVGDPVPKHLKLTPAQAHMLRNERAGRPLHAGLQGRSEHGGATHTMRSLLQRALLRREGGLTADGNAALLLADAKLATAPSTPSSPPSTQALLVDACSPRGET